MSATAITSVASFSAVLAETFAAVGLSTIVPNLFIATAKAVKAAATTSGGTPPPDLSGDAKAMFAPDSPVNKAIDLIKKGAASVDHLDVLVPTKATIDAEFEFHGKEGLTGNVGIGAAVEVVTIKAGYSAMYESTSRNKVTLHVEFGLVGIDL